MKGLKTNSKTFKGITLIALVITIIILLILAGISISALTQTGLFEKANKAKQKSENAQALENATLADYENSINEIVTAGSRGNNNNENQYSLEEKEIGTWIDGKKIYRKTITGSTLPASGTILISNVDSVINSYGEQLYGNTVWYSYPFSNWIYWELHNTDNTLRVSITNQNNTTAYKWTFEYTKSTDTATNN